MLAHVAGAALQPEFEHKAPCTSELVDDVAAGKGYETDRNPRHLRECGLSRAKLTGRVLRNAESCIITNHAS